MRIIETIYRSDPNPKLAESDILLIVGEQPMVYRRLDKCKGRKILLKQCTALGTHPFDRNKNTSY